MWGAIIAAVISAAAGAYSAKKTADAMKVPNTPKVTAVDKAVADTEQEIEIGGTEDRKRRKRASRGRVGTADTASMPSVDGGTSQRTVTGTGLAI